MKLILQHGVRKKESERERHPIYWKKDEREYEMKWKWGKTRAALGIKNGD